MTEYLEVAPDFTLPKRTYRGICDDEEMIVSVDQDHMFLSKLYGFETEAVKLSWRFNEEGRIHSVDAKDTSTQEISSVIRTQQNRLEWVNCKATGLNLTQKLLFRSGLDLGILSASERYERIIQLGHELSRKLDLAIQSRTIESTQNRLMGEQIPLERIMQDAAGIAIAQRSAMLQPTISDYNPKNRRFTINYQLFQ